jgi:hypothetical protein
MQNGHVDPPDRHFNLGEAWKQAKEKSRVDGLIGSAVRGGARGKTRDEARQLFVEGLRAHGRTVPPQPWLDAHLDTILAADSPLGRAQVNVQGVKALGDLLVGTVKLFKTGKPLGSETDEVANKTPVIGDRHRTVEVKLDPETQGWIGQASDKVMLEFRGTSQLYVELHLTAKGVVEVLVDSRHAGVLDSADVDEFLPILSAGSNHDHRLTISGIRRRAENDEWHLWVNLPDADYIHLFGWSSNPT